MAQGDTGALSALLDDDITWHESTPGAEDDCYGRDQVLALLGKVLRETGVRVSRTAVQRHPRDSVITEFAEKTASAPAAGR